MQLYTPFYFTLQINHPKDRSFTMRTRYSPIRILLLLSHSGIKTCNKAFKNLVRIVKITTMMIPKFQTPARTSRTRLRSATIKERRRTSERIFLKMTNKDNMDDSKMLCKLMTEATEAATDDLASDIGKVKPGDNHKESIKNLHSIKKEVLARIYAFLMNKSKDNENVIKFTKEGLELMIMNRLKQLIPDVFKKCKKNHFTSREEIPEVTCRMYNTGACRECFPVEEGMNKWIHLCTVCDIFVQQQRGEEALEKSHFNQKV